MKPIPEILNVGPQRPMTGPGFIDGGPTTCVLCVVRPADSDSDFCELCRFSLTPESGTL